MLRTWSLARLIPALVFLLAATPTLAREPGDLLEGFVVPPVVLPVDPEIAYYSRPTFAEIVWPLIPYRFCSAAEKEAFLASLDQPLGVASANVQLAQVHRIGLQARLREAQRLRDPIEVIARLKLELDQLDHIVRYHSVVRQTWWQIRDRMRAMPVVDCEPGVELPEPALPPSPPVSVDMDGYFVDPIIATPEDLNVLYALGGRPHFARPNFPAIALTFCSQAQKDAYLAEVAAALAVAEVNARLARQHLDNLYSAAGRSADVDLAAKLYQEITVFGPVASHYEEVAAAWRSIQARMKALPITDCEPPEDLAPSQPPTPQGGVHPPGFDPYGLPELPKQFCSEEERLAFLAEVYQPFAGQASAEAVEATRRLAELSDMLDQANRRDAEGPAIDQLRREHEELSRRVAWLTERARAAIALRKAILAIPVTPCQEPVDGATAPPPPTPPAPPAPPDQTAAFPPPDLVPVEMIELPNRFCSESERTAFLTDVYHPAAQRASRNAVEAATHLADLSRIIADGPNATYSEAAIEAARRAHARFAPIAAFHRERALRFINLRAAILLIPVVNCEQLEDVDEPERADLTPPPAPRPCPPKPEPIIVGANSAVGSGARLRDKAVSTAVGVASSLLGVGGLPGGGRSDEGPKVVRCRIKDSELTVFTDPATGVSLMVGARRVGDEVEVFAKVGKSPDKGTFQAAYLENPDGGAMAPDKVDICDLWGEWKLTVSWTKTTYVNNQVVNRESGGWSESGRFSIPGVASTEAAPDGLWKRLGFSNASNGARQIAMRYPVSREAMGEPVDLVMHLTRPGQDPVTTVPFQLRMTEGPDGFTFAETPACEAAVP